MGPGLDPNGQNANDTATPFARGVTTGAMREAGVARLRGAGRAGRAIRDELLAGDEGVDADADGRADAAVDRGSHRAPAGVAVPSALDRHPSDPEAAADAQTNERAVRQRVAFGAR